MSKKSVGRMVFLLILKTFFVIVLLAAAAVASYIFTMKYYEVSDAGQKDDIVLDIVGDVTADEVSRNIIYSVDSETRKVKAMVIEVLNTHTNNLDYLTIPVESEFIISNEVYQRMCAAGVDAPQIIRMESINDYFDNDRAYEYGILILEDCLGIDIGYYTAFDSSEFDRIFNISETSGAYEISPTILTEANQYKTDDDIDGMIKDKCENALSNLKVKNRTKYAQAYSNVVPELIYYHVITGEMSADVYNIDAQDAYAQYQTILSASVHDTPQSQAAMISSEGKKITVLNGTGVAGLAAATEKLLNSQGMTVSKISDNPQKVQRTQIYVKEDGMGQDLLYNFKNPELAVKKLDKGVDILIIVGLDDTDILNR